MLYRGGEIGVPADGFLSHEDTCPGFAFKPLTYPSSLIPNDCKCSCTYDDCTKFIQPTRYAGREYSSTVQQQECYVLSLGHIQYKYSTTGIELGMVRISTVLRSIEAHEFLNNDFVGKVTFSNQVR